MRQPRSRPGEPAGQVNCAALPGDVTANALEPRGPMQATTITPDSLSSDSHVEATSHPLILNVTSLSDAIQAPVSGHDDRELRRSGELRCSAE